MNNENRNKLALKDTQRIIDGLHSKLDVLDTKLAESTLTADDVAQRNRLYAILGEMYHNKRFIEAELSK
jgi:hypothetical protein